MIKISELFPRKRAVAPWQCLRTRPGSSRIDPAGGLGLRLGEITEGSLLTHIKSIHEGVEFPCEQCDYKATQRAMEIDVDTELIEFLS